MTLGGGDRSVQMGHMCSLARARDRKRGRQAEQGGPHVRKAGWWLWHWLLWKYSSQSVLNPPVGSRPLPWGGHGLRRRAKALSYRCDIGTETLGGMLGRLGSPVELRCCDSPLWGGQGFPTAQPVSTSRTGQGSNTSCPELVPTGSWHPGGISAGPPEP